MPALIAHCWCIQRVCRPSYCHASVTLPTRMDPKSMPPWHDMQGDGLATLAYSILAMPRSIGSSSLRPVNPVRLAATGAAAAAAADATGGAAAAGDGSARAGRSPLTASHRRCCVAVGSEL